MSSLLRKKIFLGYIIITAIVLFLTVVMVNERFRFRRFEGVINETNYAVKIFQDENFMEKLILETINFLNIGD